MVESDSTPHDNIHNHCSDTIHSLYIRTNDVAAHCATVARRHRYSCAMSPHKTASSDDLSARALLALCVLLVYSCKVGRGNLERNTFLGFLHQSGCCQ